MDFESPYTCSTLEMNFDIQTERYIEKFMMKHLSLIEYIRRLRSRNIAEERKWQCSIYENHCELKNSGRVGLSCGT